MLNRILSTTKKFLFPLTIVLIALFVCYKNYSSGTFLTGWDTLHPEFNYGIYWKRMISGAWQSHQGLGSVASQAHISEIPRVIIISLLDIFFATNLIRYLYAFLMLVLGPLGVYFFIKKIILKNTDEVTSSFGGFGGGLFYLLNLGTLQHFNVPLEMFLTHYGLLGWSFMFLTKFFDSGNKKDLLVFVLVSFLISPQAHTPTLFYVYFMFVFIYVLFLILNKLFFKNKNDPNELSKMLSIKRGVVIVAVSLIANFYWFLPNFYYGVEKGNEVSLSKIHHLFSEEAFLVNKKYGNIKDASILKNFLFDWGVYSGNNSYSDLLGTWIMHLKKPLVEVLSYLIPLSMVVGVILSFLKRNKYAIIWVVMGFVSVFFIFNVNPPFGFIFELLQNNIPLFKELFRFPFTKFSIFLMLVYSVFFGYFTAFVSQSLTKNAKSKIFKLFFFLLTVSSLAYFSLPAFKGQLINPAMRVDIPDRYFEMFKYFDSQKEYGRIADLPIHSFWGWVTYSWNQKGTGYQGAGFLWFGIKQPLIDREFDRWNIANEQPYRELSTAVYSENSELLKKTLEKYKIRWLILDESVVAPGMDNKVLFFEQTKNLLSETSGMVLDRDFGNGLAVYKYNPENEFRKIETINSYVVVKNSLFKEYSDPIYQKYGDYISGNGALYQFVGFNSVDENIDGSLVYSDAKSIYFKLPGVSSDVSNAETIPITFFLRTAGTGRFVEIMFDTNQIGRIDMPDEKGKILMKVNKDIFDLSQVGGDGFIGSSIISLKDIPKVNIYKVGESKAVGNFLYSNLESCNPLEEGANSSYSFSRINSGFEISARNTVACATVSLADVVLEEQMSDLILLDFKSDTSVSPMDFCVLDNSSGLCVDRFMGDGYFAVNVEGDFKKYNIRFFADARNLDTDSKRIYKDINVYNTDLIYSGVVYINTDEGLKINDYLVFNKTDGLTLEPEEMFGNRRNCQRGDQEVNESNFFNTDKGLVFNSTEGSLCDSYAFPLAEHNIGYVLEVRASYREGVPLRICVTNEYSKRCDLEVSLPAEKSGNSYFYIIPPMGKGAGYTVNVSNYVFGNTLSENELQYVSLVPVSYELIKNIRSNSLAVVGKQDDLFILNEAFDDGWIALCNFRICDADHVKVNNWANGWVFNNGIPDNIRVFFWPQILEYIGFVFLGCLVVFSFRYKEKQITNSLEKPPSDGESHSVDRN